MQPPRAESSEMRSQGNSSEERLTLHYRMQEGARSTQHNSAFRKSSGPVASRIMDLELTVKKLESKLKQQADVQKRQLLCGHPQMCVKRPDI